MKKHLLSILVALLPLLASAEAMSVAVISITLSQSTATLTTGENLTLTATITPSDADINLISWSSSNPSVATVDTMGKVTAVAPGTATATDGSDVTASCEVNVIAPQQDSYTITYMVDGEVYYQESLEYGSAIVVPDAPTKEGYTFSGWGDVADTMPANDVIILGTFFVNSYTITYMVDGEVYYQESLEYGSAIVVPDAPTNGDYTFSGWSEVPETMPAHDVTITGSFVTNTYTVTFMVDGEVYHQDSLEYGSVIVVPDVPTKEGYTFDGWSEVPDTMPAYDVTITGAFTINKYIVTFMVDDEVIASDTVEYGATIIVPEEPTKEGYTFSGWSEVPDTMPAHDVTITGTFVENGRPDIGKIASGICGDDLTWVLTEEYELIIEGTGAMYDYTSNNIPWGNYRKSIQAITLSEEMTSIGDYAFSNCSVLTAITIPESVTSIGYRAFYRCSKLATATITGESQLTSIGYAAFEGCSRLTDIVIPCGVTSIGEYAFFSCKKLASITCYAAIPPVVGGTSTFYSVDKAIPVHVLDYAVEAYKAAKHWNEFAYFITMETGIENSELRNHNSEMIYDLHGRRVTDTEGLQGIYIIDGRKVVIK